MKKHSIHNNIEEFDYPTKLVYGEIFDSKQYSNWIDIEPNDIVVDFGAHIGLFMIYAAEKNAKIIYSVEPSPKNYKHLCKNISETVQLGYSSHIISLPYAVSDETGKVQFETLYSLDDFPIAGAIKDDISDTTVSVDSISFKDFIEGHKIKNIDYLKVDIEGAEFYLFDDSYFIDYIKDNVKKMSFELHIQSDNVNKYDKCIESLNKIKDIGFDIFITSCDGVEITNVFMDNYFLTDQEKHAKDYYTSVLVYCKKEV